MTDDKHEILFLIRAYNDLDIQFPLIKEFADDNHFIVHIIFYPCDGFITHTNCHEAIPYFSEKFGVQFGSVLEQPATPLWLKMLHLFHKKIYSIRQQEKTETIQLLSIGLKVLDVGIRKLMYSLFQENAAWFKSIGQNWTPKIIILDEILFQPGRAPFLETILPRLEKNGAKIFAIVTGHRVYKAVNPTKQEALTNYKPSNALHYFVPSEHNRRIYSQLFPKENITVAGNLRMDRQWIDFIHGQIITKCASLPNKPVKIVLMLSKLNYGVHVDQIKKTIKKLGSMPEVALAVKPHTRGMKFDFMSKREIGDAVIADTISSTQLIEWADMVLMTGSSIVFHAMILGKVTGFLKYCQKLETIFDDGKSCKVYESLDDLVSYLKNCARNGACELSNQEEKNLQSFIIHEIHGGILDGKVARNYKEIILSDLNFAKNHERQESQYYEHDRKGFSKHIHS